MGVGVRAAALGAEESPPPLLAGKLSLPEGTRVKLHSQPTRVWSGVSSRGKRIPGRSLRGPYNLLCKDFLNETTSFSGLYLEETEQTLFRFPAQETAGAEESQGASWQGHQPQEMWTGGTRHTPVSWCHCVTDISHTCALWNDNSLQKDKL